MPDLVRFAPRLEGATRVRMCRTFEAGSHREGKFDQRTRPRRQRAGCLGRLTEGRVVLKHIRVPLLRAEIVPPFFCQNPRDTRADRNVEVLLLPARSRIPDHV